jgi:hypothetical protein
MRRALVGTFDICAAATNIARALRTQGWEVETAVWRKHEPHFGHLTYDHMLSEPRPELQFYPDAGGAVRCVPSRAYFEFLLGFDLYVFVASHSLLPAGLDLPLLRSAGKTVACYLCGSDVRHWTASEPMWVAYGSKLSSAIKAKGTIGRTADMRELIENGVYYGSLASKLHNLRFAEAYADAIFSTHEQSALALRPFHAFRIPIDLDAIRFAVPGREVPRVVHAPGNTGTKHSDQILGALDELRAEGVAFDLHHLDNMPQHRLLEVLADADVLIDEMSLYPASLAHEAMAAGCAVLAGNAHGVNPLPANRPVVHIDGGCLKARVRRVLADRELRVALAHAGRAYVERTCALPAFGKWMLGAIAEAQAGVAEYYPRYFADDCTNVLSEPLPPYLEGLTLDVLRTHGAMPQSDLRRLITAGFLADGAAGALADVPRWETGNLNEDARWALYDRRALGAADAGVAALLRRAAED